MCVRKRCTKEENKMMYKGIEITKRISGGYLLKSPINGTLLIFGTLKMAKQFIDKCIG